MTHRGDGVPELDDLHLRLLPLVPHPDRAVVAGARDQPLALSTDLNVHRVHDAAVPAEATDDGACCEVVEEDGVVGRAGDERGR